MTVKMLVPTRWDGKNLKAGDTVEVADGVAKRWEGARIAKPVEVKAKPIEQMNTKELTKKAAELGVDISAATTNPQRAEMIMAHIAINGE